MTTTPQTQRRGQIVKILFDHDFAIHGTVVELRNNLNEQHGRIYPIKEIDHDIVKNYLNQRISQIEHMLIEITAIKNHFSVIRAESQHQYDISEYERMTKERGKCFKSQLHKELQQAFDELETYGSPIDPDQENWETQ